MWLWIIYCTLCAVRAVCSDIQAYLQHFFGLFDPCKLNSTTKLPADASFQPDKQCEPNLFTSCGVQCFFLTWFLYCMSRVSLLNFWLLTLDEATAGLLIQELQLMCIGPATCLLGRYLQAFSCLISVLWPPLRVQHGSRFRPLTLSRLLSRAVRHTLYFTILVIEAGPFSQRRWWEYHL